MRFRDFAISASALFFISKTVLAQTDPRGQKNSLDDSTVSVSANSHFAVRVIALFYPDRIQDDSTMTGSGIYFKKNNRHFVITNFHVVRNREYFIVSFSNGGGNREGTVLTAILRGVDSLEDIALLEINPTESSKIPAPAIFGSHTGDRSGEFIRQPTDHVAARCRPHVPTVPLPGGVLISHVAPASSRLWSRQNGGATSKTLPAAEFS